MNAFIHLHIIHIFYLLKGEYTDGLLLLLKATGHGWPFISIITRTVGGMLLGVSGLLLLLLLHGRTYLTQGGTDSGHAGGYLWAMHAWSDGAAGVQSCGIMCRRNGGGVAVSYGVPAVMNTSVSTGWFVTVPQTPA